MSRRYGRAVQSDRGIALILALLFLSFLTILGGALLATSTIDIWISDNYKTATQVLYLTEAGIEQARETLRVSATTPSQMLVTASGADGMLATADDQALLTSTTDAGRYDVWLRNDIADGITSLTDSNRALTLVGVGRIGPARKTIEVTVRKGEFPQNPPDTVTGLESLAASIASNANDIYSPASGTSQTIGNYGGPSDYLVAVVNGDAELGPGSGFGVLLVRGTLRVTGSFNWTGLILVIGQGVLDWDENIPGLVTGGRFLARTRAADGTLLASPLDVVTDFNDTAAIEAANRTFPYTPISVRER